LLTRGVEIRVNRSSMTWRVRRAPFLFIGQRLDKIGAAERIDDVSDVRFLGNNLLRAQRHTHGILGWDREGLVGEALASAGLLVAVADYRIHPQGRYPDFLHDGAKAFAILRRIVASYGGDPDRIFLAGHSAGAYIAVMLALDARYVRREGEDIGTIHGVIGIAGSYDFLPVIDPTQIEIFGGPERPETQPIRYVDGKKPPTLLATGANDGRVQVKSTRNLSALLRAIGGEVEERIYPNVGHMGIILSLAPPSVAARPCVTTYCSLFGRIKRIAAGHSADEKTALFSGAAKKGRALILPAKITRKQGHRA
jgi:alpha/beta hydrolase fold